MTNDRSHSGTGSTPPDAGAAGDVSTTGHSTTDAHAAAPVAHAAGAAHDAGDARGAHDATGPTTHDADDAHGGGHGSGHGDDAAAEVSTLVRTNWKQLIFPVLIIILVAILLIGPVTGAFRSQPTPPPSNEHRTGGGGSGTTEGMAVSPSASAIAQLIATATSPPTTAPAPPTATTAPVAQPPTATTAPALTDAAIATRTAVAIAGEQGVVTRAPVQLNFAGAQFEVVAGNNLLPDWKPAADEGRATWLGGTYANHVIYLPYSDSNANLFRTVKLGDIVSLKMNTGQSFEFSVTRSERAGNGPPASDGQFTVTTAMSQDRAAVTLVLVGDPAPDRAVVQADFDGTIQ